MSNRNWFYAADGQQKGPLPETQLRDLIARGMVRADTLVWTEGMAGWQKAGEIPGLVPGSVAAPVYPRAGGPPPVVASASYNGGALSADFPIWGLFGRTLLMVIGQFLVIPAPWTATGLYRWATPNIQVPGRPNLGFTGQPLDIWYVFIVLGLMAYAGLADSTLLSLLSLVLQAFLQWMIVRWFISRLSSNGQDLPISFKGSAAVYIGWYLLMVISAITIIGWAWVLTAWMRWICRNIEGSRREITFNASGLDMLWRTIVFTIGCAFLIPIPWVLRWYSNWFVAQFAVVERSGFVSV
ncbi:DUF4339 domain-containing protein [Bradyrhizobium sp. WSM 1704]|uniref:DUF4339 domain-containing protein n=1 Tax=Bradyrhizobium semiaridum TaxID=2821404 RepID=UPI001CE260BB|nr:DUF4339 domain-containing protein [Bradyrhizobium semiaridum]MCA6123367.1 DUF4339 domain-containing protein [Bradyrhizobium semiaridum]